MAGLDGVGKTRLALEVAGRLHADSELPVLWCTLRDGPRDYRADASAARYAELLRGLVEEIFPAPARGLAAAESGPAPRPTGPRTSPGSPSSSGPVRRSSSSTAWASSARTASGSAGCCRSARGCGCC